MSIAQKRFGTTLELLEGIGFRKNGLIYYIPTTGIRSIYKQNGLLDWLGKTYDSYLSIGTININTDNPGSIIYIPTISKIFIVISSTNEIININPDSFFINSTISVDSTPSNLCYSPINNKVYVTNSSTSTINVIDMVSLLVTETISVSTTSTKIIFCPSNNYLYFLGSSGNIYSLNPLTSTIISTISISTSEGIAYCPINDKIYVTQNSNVLKINITSNLIEKTITVSSNPTSITYCPTNNKFYIGTRSQDINEINIETEIIESTISSLFNVECITYWPSLDRIIFSGPKGTGQACILDPQNRTITKTLSVGNYPINSCYCPINNSIFISCGESGGNRWIEKIIGV